MKEITLQEAVTAAKAWESEGQKWHFHMFTPDCLFNELNDKHSLVLENTNTTETLFCLTDERPFVIGKQLVELLHGKEITQSSAAAVSNPALNKILAKAKTLNGAGQSWHHHLFFPDCQYNNQVGLWNIVMEAKSEGELLEASYQNEPIDDLRKVEELFYAQEK
ncbi:MAG: hypothetical protein Q8Q20_01935 [bacterium]|nr:hypothetical protein [bacterium]